MQRWEMHRNCPWIVSTSQFYYINQKVEGVETRPLERLEKTGWLKCVAQNLGSSLAWHACTCLTADRSPITILSQSIWIHSCCIFVHPIWLVVPLIQNMTAAHQLFKIRIQRIFQYCHVTVNWRVHRTSCNIYLESWFPRLQIFVVGIQVLFLTFMSLSMRVCIIDAFISIKCFPFLDSHTNLTFCNTSSHCTCRHTCIGTFIQTQAQHISCHGNNRDIMVRQLKFLEKL